MRDGGRFRVNIPLQLLAVHEPLATRGMISRSIDHRLRREYGPLPCSRQPGDDKMDAHLHWSRFLLRPHSLCAAPLSRCYLEFRPWRQSPNGRKGGRVLSPHSMSPSTPLFLPTRPQPSHQPRLRSTLLAFFSLRSEWAPFPSVLVGCWLMYTGLNGQQIKLRRTGASLRRRL